MCDVRAQLPADGGARAGACQAEQAVGVEHEVGRLSLPVTHQRVHAPHLRKT